MASAKKKTSIKSSKTSNQAKTVRPIKTSNNNITSNSENNFVLSSLAILLAALVIAVFTAILVIVIHSRNIAAKNNTAQVLTSQQIGISGSTKVSISKVTENSKMDYAFTFLPTDTMLIMNVNITNLTAKSQHLIPVNMLYVRTDEGDYSALHPSMYTKHLLGSTELKPGQSSNGVISFAVPKRAANPLLYVDTGWDNYVPIVFNVLH